jgi:UDP-N-acetylglucosamine 2-epimerase
MHPKMPSEFVARYRALAGPNLTFFESNHNVIPLLRTGDVMLCDTSSIAFEFMLLDKPVVTFRTKVPGPHVLNVREKGLIESALAKALTRPADQIKAMRNFIDRIHPYRDGLSAKRVLEATEALLMTRLETMRNKPINLLRKLKIRRKLGYYHWR